MLKGSHMMDILDVESHYDIFAVTKDLIGKQLVCQTEYRYKVNRLFFLDLKLILLKSKLTCRCSEVQPRVFHAPMLLWRRYFTWCYCLEEHQESVRSGLDKNGAESQHTFSFLTVFHLPQHKREKESPKGCKQFKYFRQRK